MKHKKIPWEIEPHTQAKLEILMKYLQPWFVILSSTHNRLVYIDGFAGPGEYIYNKKLADGSPVVAIKAFLEHKLRDKIKEVIFIFVEKDPECFQYLQKKIAPYLKQGLKLDLKNDEFENVVNEIFDYLAKENAKIAPTFCFIDPFGIKGLPMDVIERVMGNKHCEVLINFMYEDLNRFISLPQNQQHVTDLFGGTTEWKKVANIKDPQKRYFFLTSLYEKQLREKCSVNYIRTFDMTNKHNKKDYVLFFCTNSKLGLEKMKESMWKVDEKGGFTFSDATYNPYQMTLFEDKPDYTKLKKTIQDKFRKKQVTIEELSDFVLVNTPFLPKSHLKTPVLKPMETEGEIKILAERKRKGTYPPGTVIKFL